MSSEPELLLTESDVEQKIVWPMLTSSPPVGLGFSAADVVTKLSIRRLEIGKGSNRKIYFPDYLVVLAGLPLLVIEAKAPSEAVELGLDEARLYANEINALLPSGINPCGRVVACNGRQLLSAPVDTAAPDVTLDCSDLSLGHADYARFVDVCGRAALQRHADDFRRLVRRDNYVRAVQFVGGETFQNEELPPNTFGATIAGDYGHIFNPRTRGERAFIARNGYVPSLRRQRYVEPIDRLIRNAVAPVAAKIEPLEDTGEPSEITSALRDRRSLENQVLLLVGSVGAGKSTFVDYLSVVALPKDIRDRTLWLRVNLNEAPLAKDLVYSWLARSLIDEFREQCPDIDFDAVRVLEKIFAPELRRFKRGPVALLRQGSAEYVTRVADRLMALQQDAGELARGIARYTCGGPGKLLVIVLDNCDKRTRDEQLLMFQIAQWVQHEFHALVVLPLRDVTYDLHRHEPPLDTALKNLVFRIEPPPFSDVLQSRVRLALDAMRSGNEQANELSFELPNGYRVSYPASDQAKYLASILRSLYAHDRFVRQVMTGLAGRDVRRALEIFLDFCTSGHIGEGEIFKIRLFEGRYELVRSMVARVLLRMHRRFYDGNKGHLKNLVQCRPEDPLPDHFGRLSILHWLNQRLNIRGPAGVNGFHQVRGLVAALSRLGHDAVTIRDELHYLTREQCVVSEHLRTDLQDDDLVKITASGVVHLQLMANPEYLAACAEDTYLGDEATAGRIAARCTERDVAGHFSRTTTAKNAGDLLDYLRRQAGARFSAPEVFLTPEASTELKILREAEAAIAASEIEVSRRLFVANLPNNASEDDLREAFGKSGIKVDAVTVPQDGVRNRGFGFVHVADGQTAMKALGAEGSLRVGQRVVRIEEAHEENTAASVPRAHATSERVFVGNLPYNTADETTVRRLFADNDLTAIDVHVVVDPASGRSRGYAFVSLRSLEEAQQAIDRLHGTRLQDRALIVSGDTSHRRRR